MYVREGERVKQWFVHFLGVAKVSNKTETFIFAQNPKHSLGAVIGGAVVPI